MAAVLLSVEILVFRLWRAALLTVLPAIPAVSFTSQMVVPHLSFLGVFLSFVIALAQAGVFAVSTMLVMLHLRRAVRLFGASHESLVAVSVRVKDPFCFATPFLNVVPVTFQVVLFIIPRTIPH